MRQPHQGGEAAQGPSKLGLGKDKIQEVIIPAEAELAVPLVIKNFIYRPFDSVNIFRVIPFKTALLFVTEGVYLRKILQVLAFCSL